jgi:hypothetical protein
MRTALLFISFIVLLSAGCSRDIAAPGPPKIYKTEKVVLIVIDGPRYTDINSDSALVSLPEWSALLSKSKLHTEIYNTGATNTVNGLSHLTTGIYGALGNNGSDTPKNKTFFHSYLQDLSINANKAAIFSSKDKIGVLQKAGNGIPPFADCGATGGGYRSDSITLSLAKNYVSTQSPNLLLVHFAEPDISGHTGNYESYKNAIATTTKSAAELYNFLEDNAYYKGKTTYLFANDHGRHTTEFTSHGDGCMGCRHLFLLTIGPDTQPGKSFKHASQIDIASTIAELLHLKSFRGDGRILEEVLQ